MNTPVTGPIVAPRGGAWMAIVDGDTVQILRPDVSAPMSAFALTPGSAVALAAAPDGTWLAAASGDRTIRVADPSTGAARPAVPGSSPRSDCRITVPVRPHRSAARCSTGRPGHERVIAARSSPVARRVGLVRSGPVLPSY
jgi:hypothetical protein